MEDDDGIASIELSFTTPEEEHDFSVTIEPQSTGWDTTFSHTFSHTGQATFFWEVIDAFDGDPETNQGNEQTTVVANQIAYTLEGTLTNPVLESPAVGVTAELRGPGGELLDQGESAADGTVSLSHAQPDDDPTVEYTITLSGTGYLDADLEVDLQNLADGGEMEIEQITLEQTSTNLSSEQESGSIYRLSVENDVAATTESITIRARTSTNDQTEHVEVLIGERAHIAITQSQFEVTEDDTLVLNPANYVNSGADIDSLHISTSASQLENIRDGSGLYTLILDKDYYGDLQIGRCSSSWSS